MATVNDQHKVAFAQRHSMESNYFPIILLQLFRNKNFQKDVILWMKMNKNVFTQIGYVLDIQTGYLFKDTEITFCALFDSVIDDCIEFQPRFVRIHYTKQGAYLGESFINSDLISKNSTSQQIICLESLIFLIIQTHQIIEGCYQNIQNNNLKNCIFYFMEKICYQCKKDFALRDDKMVCENVIPNCIEFMVIDNKNVCTKCIQYFKLQSQNCIEIRNYQLLSRQNPNKCIGCKPGYFLQNSECISIKQDFITQEEKYFLEGKKNIQKDEKQVDNYFQDAYDNKYDKNKRKKRDEQNNTNIQINKSINYVEGNQNGGKRIVIAQKIYNQFVNFFQINKISQIKENNSSEMITSFQLRILSNNSKQNKLQNQKNDNGYQGFQLRNIQQINISDEESIAFGEKYCVQYYVMSAQEIEILRNTYLSLGINITHIQNQCNNKDQYGIFSCIQLENKCKCSNTTYLSLNQNKDFSYLVFDCVQELQMENKLIDKCVKYDLQKKFCFECEEGFHFNSKTFLCEKKILNCLIHSLKNTCIVCQSGYLLINNTICYPICGSYIPGTQSFYNSFIQNNYDDQKNICKRLEIPCFKLINDQCFECIDGYVLDQANNFTCIRDIDFLNCIVIQYQLDQKNKLQTSSHSFDGKECIKCSKDYVLKQGLCFCQKQQCLNYIFCDEKQCFKKYVCIFIGFLNLPSNYYLEKYREVYQASECKIQFCFQCEEGNICIRCFCGFYYDKNQQNCIYNRELQFIVDSQLNYPVESACQIYDQSLKSCTKCNKDHFLMDDLRCYKKCKNEQVIYETDNHGKICFKCPIGCQQCEFSIQNFLNRKLNNYCQGCYQDYFIFNQVCIKECNFYKIYYTKQCVIKCSTFRMFQFNQQCVEWCSNNYYQIQGTEKICIDSCQELLRYEDDQFKCSKECQDGYVLIDQVCKKCVAKNCLICSPYNLSECLKCKQYQKIQQVHNLNIDGKCKIVCLNQMLVEEMDSCYQMICNQQNQNNCLKCPETFIYNSQIKKCQCPPNSVLIQSLWLYKNICDKNCQQCISKKNMCYKCSPDTFKIQLDNYNTICLDYCPKGYFGHIQSQECFYQYYMFQALKRAVPYGTIIYIYIYYIYVQKKCCLVQNCAICSQDKQICNKCFRGLPFLLLNTCLESCPDGFYADQYDNCYSCHPFCKTCSQSSTNCTSCVLNKNNAQSETFRCRNEKIFFSKQCYSLCPKFTKLIKEYGYCQEYCSESKSFPVFNDIGEFEGCESYFKDINSKFCEQNLINLDKYITFQIENQNQQISVQNEILNIIIQIDLTPNECYDFSLRTDLSDDSNSLQLILKDYTIIDRFNFNFKLKTTINVSQMQQNTCEGFKTCSSELVQAYPYSTINFSIQNVLENDKLQIINPLSVYIMQDDKTLVPIDSFYYQNCFPSQMELSIQFQKIIKGKLMMIFKTNNWKF
ncbi:hypothetical protein ABPG72_013389 [Tetrahymena utriculariae]